MKWAGTDEEKDSLDLGEVESQLLEAMGRLSDIGRNLWENRWGMRSLQSRDRLSALNSGVDLAIKAIRAGVDLSRLRGEDHGSG